MEIVNGHKIMFVEHQTTADSAVIYTFKVHCDKYDTTWNVYRYIYGNPLECIYCGREVLR